MQNKHITCLILLDLSSAFDTISHSKLINRLKFICELDGVVLNCITDYLANHTQHVVIKQGNFSNSATSSSVTLTQGIPQGLVLGLNLCSWFSSPLGNLCRNYEIDCNGYADNRQLYLSFKPMIPIDQVTCIRRLELYITEITCWMRTNFLKLKDCNTQFILLGTQNQLQMVNKISIKIRDAIIQPTDCVRNLGYMYDAEVKKNISHINKLVSTCYVTLRKISGIRDLLDYDTCKILIQALVLAKADYCDSLLLGSSLYMLQKLQKIQNMGAQVINHERKYDHISQDIELHWLKIPKQIQHKVPAQTLECVSSDPPTHLKDLVNTTHNHVLHSTTNNDLPLSMSRLSQIHKSSCSIMTGRIWNDLLSNIKYTTNINILKTGLKTVLLHKPHNW